MENLGIEAKIAVTWYLFGRRAEERGVCQPVDSALLFRSFRTILSRAFFLVRTVLLSELCVSSDKPRLKAFCRVAPSVLLNVRAIFVARVLLPASFFKVRTSLVVHARLFIVQLLDQKMKVMFLATNTT